MNKSLEWHTVSKKVDNLIPQEVNPRTITTKQMEDLKKSLRRFNLAEIPAIDFDGKILAGHQRIKALKLLGRGEEMIDVRIPNRKLSDDEAKQYLIGSNAIGGNWNFDLLKDFDVDLLLDVGFDQNELSRIWDEDMESKDENFDPEKETERITNIRTKTGDIILLGKHRLICGDSTDKKVLEKLTDDKKPKMIISDPPYNINLDYSKGIGQKQNYGGTVNDSLPYEEYKSFLKKAIIAGLEVSPKNLHLFYWVDQTHIGTVQDIYRELGVFNRRVCLWIKNSQNPTPQVAFNKCYEPCVYGTLGKPALNRGKQEYNEILNEKTGTGNDLFDDIWLIKRKNTKDYLHPTMKPASLYYKAILRCTKPGDIILDSFGGSGSTLIAGEQTKRTVYMVEREPIFCDVIVRRWEKLTGKKAEYLTNHEVKQS